MPVLASYFWQMCHGSVKMLTLREIWDEGYTKFSVHLCNFPVNQTLKSYFL